MTKFHHFVVVYNADTGEFEEDSDTAAVRFDDGLVWDDQTEEWEEVDDGNNGVIDNEATVLLAEKLKR